MIDYKNCLNSNIVEITVEGKITKADIEQTITQLKLDLKHHGKLRILEEIRSFDGIDPIALWQDVNFGLAHANDFTHAAVVADAKWIQTLSQAIDSVLPAQVKVFEQSQIELAREWLLNIPDKSEHSAIEYKNNSDSNIVEIYVDGKITETDLERVISLLKVDLQKHGKLRILENIRSFEGIDPIALWKDLNFGLSHVDDITHAAVVADAKWMRTFAEALDNVLSAKVKAFEAAQIDEAKIWLASS
ncbi:STAS/SEC14 domain-containing protein [Pleurocapsales cyanobacterium LEGE 10410]|nr:STAS/SEC14 domain-containing protein [Pleurocapsales cyanobacterium LEGE 10410]